MNKYYRSPETESHLKDYNAWLQQQGYSPSTIRQIINYTGYFLEWFQMGHAQKSLKALEQEVSYNHLLQFIGYCTEEEKKSKPHINRILSVICKYYRYLGKRNPNLVNPAAGLYIRGEQKKTQLIGIDYPVLENLYLNFPCGTIREKRNKVIIGLLVYQGVTTEELKQLTINDIKLSEGKVYIPGARKRNHRTLTLKPFQVMELYRYINEIRPQIISELPNLKPSRKPVKINPEKLRSQLIISMNGSDDLKNSLWHLFEGIKKHYPNIASAKQIRQGVISHWIKTNNLREVQYMAGHKYVSSTERYQSNNLENLQGKLNLYHPLN